MKKFMEDKTRELKFKLAGPGRKLSDESSAVSSNANKPSCSSLNAALQRSQEPQKKNPGPSKQLSEGISTEPSSSKRKEEKEIDCPSKNRIILFQCDGFANEVYPLNVWKEKLRTHISNIKTTDPLLASILTIKSLNAEQEAKACLAILEKYLNNLINHPNVEKYKAIRLGNTNIQKLMNIEGAIDFLYCIGFIKQNLLDEKEQKEEAYLVYYTNNELDLNEVLKSLESVNGFTLSLDRNVKFFYPSDESKDEEPDEFYEWTVQDIKKEHKSRMNELAKAQVLRTKKMRDIDKVKSNVLADYTMIRVRLPDGLVIQCTFAVNETLLDLRALLNEKIDFQDKFLFVSLPATNYNAFDEEKSFLELGLYPAVVLVVKWCDSTNKDPKCILRKKSCN